MLDLSNKVVMDITHELLYLPKDSQCQNIHARTHTSAADMAVDQVEPTWLEALLVAHPFWLLLTPFWLFLTGSVRFVTRARKYAPDPLLSNAISDRPVNPPERHPIEPIPLQSHIPSNPYPFRATSHGSFIPSEPHPSRIGLHVGSARHPAVVRHL